MVWQCTSAGWCRPFLTALGPPSGCLLRNPSLTQLSVAFCCYLSLSLLPINLLLSIFPCMSLKCILLSHIHCHSYRSRSSTPPTWFSLIVSQWPWPPHLFLSSPSLYFCHIDSLNCFSHVSPWSEMWFPISSKVLKIGQRPLVEFGVSCKGV